MAVGRAGYIDEFRAAAMMTVRGLEAALSAHGRLVLGTASARSGRVGTLLRGGHPVKLILTARRSSSVVTLTVLHLDVSVVAP